MLEQRFVSAALRRGWSVVLPDHEGPDMAYLSGRQAGHAVLDEPGAPGTIGTLECGDRDLGSGGGLELLAQEGGDVVAHDAQNGDALSKAAQRLVRDQLASESDAFIHADQMG